MRREDADILDFYDYEVTLLISDKYGFSHLDALRRFTQSDTHRLLLDADCGLTLFGAPGVFDMWEAEQVTGDPRNSIYVREE